MQFGVQHRGVAAAEHVPPQLPVPASPCGSRPGCEVRLRRTRLVDQHLRPGWRCGAGTCGSARRPAHVPNATSSLRRISLAEKSPTARIGGRRPPARVVMLHVLERDASERNRCPPVARPWMAMGNQASPPPRSARRIRILGRGDVWIASRAFANSSGASAAMQRVRHRGDHQVDIRAMKLAPRRCAFVLAPVPISPPTLSMASASCAVLRTGTFWIRSANNAAVPLRPGPRSAAARRLRQTSGVSYFPAARQLRRWPGPRSNAGSLTPGLLSASASDDTHDQAPARTISGGSFSTSLRRGCWSRVDITGTACRVSGCPRRIVVRPFTSAAVMLSYSSGASNILR